ncbi:MAG: SDR family NAD(P)-dependent oxidoreductase [Candidatus Baltobacteraceae bacterium]
MELAKRTFLITGGGSGLGAACAREFARHDAHVFIADINSEAGETVAKEIGANARFLRTDVTKEDDAAAAVKLAIEAFGSLDGAITCAGIATAQRAVGKNGALPLADFSKVIAVNLIGTFNIIRLAAQAMLRNDVASGGERGVIVCTASVAAFDGQIGQVAYAASKAGVAGMTLPLAREFAQHGVRVMTIAPGIFDTPMLAGLPEPARISLGQQVPFPARLGRPDEYASLARHIVENPMLNGEVIRLDGAVRLAPR